MSLTTASGLVFADSVGLPLFGGRGNDAILRSQSSDQIAGGSGDDTIVADGQGANIILGDHGSIDFVAYDGNPSDVEVVESTATMFGGYDTLRATQTASQICEMVAVPSSTARGFS